MIKFEIVTGYSHILLRPSLRLVWPWEKYELSQVFLVILSFEAIVAKLQVGIASANGSELNSLGLAYLHPQDARPW